MTSYSQLTYTGVLLSVLGNQLCLPIPSVVFLMAAGALSAQGKMSAVVIAGLSVLPCLTADGIWFCMGRKWGPQAVRLLCRLTSDPRASSENAQRKFRRYGLPVLCLAKFLPGLDGLIPPLAGAEGVPLTAFLALDAVGSLLWSGFYVSVGYLFSSQLDLAIDWVKQFGMSFCLVLAVPIVLYAIWRALGMLRMVRRLKLRRMTPRMLYRQLKRNSKVAVLDLLNLDEDQERSGEAIAGAFRVDPGVLLKSPRIAVPGDVKIILYCSSTRNITSARVALALKRIGVENVWVLDGGLNAWRDQGLPIAKSPETPETVADRLGVILPPLRGTANA